MPEILAQSDGWVFAASTISDGDAYFVGKKSDETEELFEKRQEDFYQHLETVFKPKIRGMRSIHVARLHHGDTIATVTNPARCHLYANTDGLVADGSSVALRITGADCPPVCIADDGGRIALVHSGRKGTWLNIAGNAVRQLVGTGSRPGSLQAIIGPGICGKCYEVSEEIAQRFVGEYPEAVQGRHLDLRVVIRSQLVKAGVADETIRDIDECTYEMSDKWFSHRRDVRNGLKSDPPRVQSFVVMLK